MTGMEEREQRVKIGDAVSKPGYPNGGVPQGTLSGSQHFLVHINDLQTPCPIYKYVDDSTIFKICNQDMVSVIQDSADLVEQWSCNNDMRINMAKTKEMVISFRRDRTFVESVPYIYMNGNYIERVSQAKVLGVTISSDILDKKMCTRYQFLERIDSVTPLYRGLYTTVSKKAINTV